MLKVKRYTNGQVYRAFMFGCDFTRVVKNDPSFAEKHKKIVSNPIFWATHMMIRSLPFQFLETLKVGLWTILPNDYKRNLRKCVSDSENEMMVRVALYSLDSDDDPIFKVLIQRKERSSTRYYYVFTRQKYVMQDLSDEPWIMQQLCQLQNASSGRSIILGPGARGNNSSHSELVPSSTKKSIWSMKNFWFDGTNKNKLCIDGAFANILHHMEDYNAAMFIKSISQLNHPTEIALAVGVVRCPKDVSRRIPDDFRKCLWIIQQKFGYRSKKLRDSLLTSAILCVTNLTGFGPPVIAILKGTNMTRDHVITIWQNQIIDYESEYTYTLTVENLNFACGVGCYFQGLVRPVAIFPPKSITTKYKCSGGIKPVWIHDHDPTVKYLSA